MPALKTHHNIRTASEPVNDLAFALVAPLCADYRYICQVVIPAVKFRLSLVPPHRFVQHYNLRQFFGFTLRTNQRDIGMNKTRSFIMRKLLIAAIATSLIFPPLAAAQLRDRLETRREKRNVESERSQKLPARKATEYKYGANKLQSLDFSPSVQGGSAPLVIFVHGGGWKRGDKRNATGQYKAAHYTSQGYAFASVNYRLVPEATIEQQAQDVANAIAWLHGKAAQLGIDKSRIVLMGHSAGAHLSALVGTDPQYLQNAGLSHSVLRGVIPLDGAAYDVPVQLTEGPSFMHETYKQAFGTDLKRQIALSPTHQAEAPNAPSFLILHVDRDDGKKQSANLANALRNAGTLAQVTHIKGRGLKGHMEINRQLGKPDYPATPVVDAWLKDRFR
jgi:arylformamidase